MFLHLGGDIVIPIKDIVSIIDASSVIKSKDTKEFFRIAEEEGFVYRISEEKPKSFVVTEKTEKINKGKEIIVKTIIYYSPISSVTLQKRASFIDEVHFDGEIGLGKK
ncbi:MAG: extracellular matrix regulator RemB [Bacillota bacterium]